MQNTLFSIVILLITGCLASCGPRPLDLGAGTVRIIQNTPKKCRFIGVIVENDIHGNMSLLSTQKELILDQTNFLKNKAAKMGANIVVFQKPEVIETKRLVAKAPMYITIATYNVKAKTYFCGSQ